MAARPEFAPSVEKFRSVITELENAQTPLEVSELERKGLYAMHDVQTAAAFIGVELKDAVGEARRRLQRERLSPSPQPVEKPVENSEQSVKKPKGRPKKTAKTTKKEK